MINKDFNSILELLQAFPDEQSCIDHLEALRWNGNIVSPFDPSSKVYDCKGNKYKCKSTGKYFNVKTNTIFDNTKLPLQKWFLGIWLVTSHKKGISSIQLSKDINITQKSAWFMLQRIRQCFGLDENDQLNGTVEVDETYVGGNPKNRHLKVRKDKSFETLDRYRKKTVLGMVERNGRIIAKHVGNASRYCLEPPIKKYISKSAKIYSDEWSSYNELKDDYTHKTINHSEGKYVVGDIHTNTIESFWATLKRGLYGIYHWTSRKHLHLYIDEFCYRYNTRQIGESAMFNLLLQNTENHITYKELIK